MPTIRKALEGSGTFEMVKWKATDDNGGLRGKSSHLIVLVAFVVSDQVLLHKQFLDNGVVDCRHGFLVALIELFLGG